MSRTLLVLFLLSAGVICGQNNSVNDKVAAISFYEYHKPKPEKRKLLRFKNRLALYNPLNYAGAGLLYAYQNLVSEQIQANCSYKISCSEFTKLSIQQYGFFIGALRGFNQLSECHPGALYEHPPVFINGNKIINTIEKESK